MQSKLCFIYEPCSSSVAISPYREAQISACRSRGLGLPGRTLEVFASGGGSTLLMLTGWESPIIEQVVLIRELPHSHPNNRQYNKIQPIKRCRLFVNP